MVEHIETKCREGEVVDVFPAPDATEKEIKYFGMKKKWDITCGGKRGCETGECNGISISVRPYMPREKLKRYGSVFP